MLHEKNIALKELEESFTLRIRDMENRIKEKEELLENLGRELKDTQTQGLVTAEIRQLEEILGSWEVAMAGVVSQLRETVKGLNQKASALKAMEDGLPVLEETITLQIADLARQVEALSKRN